MTVGPCNRVPQWRGGPPTNRAPPHQPNRNGDLFPQNQSVPRQARPSLIGFMQPAKKLRRRRRKRKSRPNPKSCPVQRRRLLSPPTKKETRFLIVCIETNPDQPRFENPNLRLDNKSRLRTSHWLKNRHPRCSKCNLLRSWVPYRGQSRLLVDPPILTRPRRLQQPVRHHQTIHNSEIKRRRKETRTTNMQVLLLCAYRMILISQERTLQRPARPRCSQNSVIGRIRTML